MQTSNTQTTPLWKSLNEQRTQGEWYVEEGIFIREGARPLMNTGIANFLPIHECESNAQYTALAVNNLHLLAEALDFMVNVVNGKANDKSKSIELRFERDTLLTWLSKAKQALNRIS